MIYGRHQTSRREKQMKVHQVVASIITLVVTASIAYAGGGTAFTYQGRLFDSGEPSVQPGVDDA